MKIQTELYHTSLERKPHSGKLVMGHQTEKSIVVYQAYNPSIADAAVKNQCLGGGGFSYERMSWIKPGFLWMMYRSGWATKENQERVLALWIDKDDFKTILSEAVPTTFKSKQFNSGQDWKDALKQNDVRLQWDPDHDPFGKKQERRAIQLGLKGERLEAFGRHYVKQIEDVTDFVKEQNIRLGKHQVNELLVPVETIMEIDEPELRRKLGINNEDKNFIPASRH
jgi:hypothetical protein